MEPPQKRAKQLLEVLGNLVDPKPHRSLIEPFKEPCQESFKEPSCGSELKVDYNRSGGGKSESEDRLESFR